MSFFRKVFNRTIIQRVFPGVLIMAGIFNVFVMGQAKVDKLDNLIGAYAEYGRFNGSVPGFNKVKLNAYTPLQLVNLFADSTLQFTRDLC